MNQNIFALVSLFSLVVISYLLGVFYFIWMKKENYQICCFSAHWDFELYAEVNSENRSNSSGQKNQTSLEDFRKQHVFCFFLDRRRALVCVCLGEEIEKNESNQEGL